LSFFNPFGQGIIFYICYKINILVMSVPAIDRTKDEDQLAVLSGSNKSVSVIIPALNEEDYIHRAILSAQVQRRSDDNTAGKARELGANKVLEIGGYGISLAKNSGFEQAEGDYIVFLDADSIIELGTLDLITNALDQGYVGGKVQVEGDDTMASKLYFSYVNACSRIAQVSGVLGFGPVNGAGACMFAQREQLVGLQRADGHIFNPGLPRMEDVDLQKRLSKLGRFKLITDKKVATSTRRLRHVGYSRVFMQDWVEWFSPSSADGSMYIR
jgi:glycosyltransferase involved in cell wall biosynthesis